MKGSDKVVGWLFHWETTWKEFVDVNHDWFSDRPEDLQAVEDALDKGEAYAEGGGAAPRFTITRGQRIAGWNLESVGTYMRADGWCFPMTTDGGYDDDEGMAVHIRDCDPEDEGHEWWQSLSDGDRNTVEAFLEGEQR